MKNQLGPTNLSDHPGNSTAGLGFQVHELLAFLWAALGSTLAHDDLAGAVLQ